MKARYGALMLLNCAFVTHAHAAPIPLKDRIAQEDKNLKPAIIASSADYGTGSIRHRARTEVPFLTEKLYPIGGSVERKGGDKCVARLKNESNKKTFRINYSIFTSNRNYRAIKEIPGTATLKPKEVTESSFRCDNNVDMALQIRNGAVTAVQED